MAAKTAGFGEVPVACPYIGPALPFCPDGSHPAVNHLSPVLRQQKLTAPDDIPASSPPAIPLSTLPSKLSF